MICMVTGVPPTISVPYAFDDDLVGRAGREHCVGPVGVLAAGHVGQLGQTGRIGREADEAVAAAAQSCRTTIVLLGTRCQVDQVIADRVTVGRDGVVREHRDTDGHGDPDHDHSEDDQKKLLLSHCSTPLIDGF